MTWMEVFRLVRADADEDMCQTDVKLTIMEVESLKERNQELWLELKRHYGETN